MIGFGGFHFVAVGESKERAHSWCGIEDVLRAQGWIIHNGGDCPCDPGSYPQMLEDTGGVDCERADSVDWQWDNAVSGNIIAWRPT